MTFATARQIVVLTVLTVLLFFGIDKWKNPRRDMFGPARVDVRELPQDQPTIRLTLNHLCCTGCESGLAEALAPLAWLGPPRVLADDLPTQAEADSAGVAAGYAQDVDLAVTDLNGVDFIALLALLRKHGFTAARMQFSGVPHYRLQAKLPHMCCPLCVKGTREAFGSWVRTEKAVGRLGWFDSFDVDKVQERLTINPRLNETVDMMAILGAVNTMGFEASELRVEVEAH